ncbi:phage tail sheath subtilisin-like domain-containing protein [Anaeromicropila herbilytica]|uniref:Phage portal protein n=1 Tax=Anaeromicropila herbilytica TaxID=2785025 RepID=A0A7R7ENW9_9FIRM|nr:phage tail sheath subtilisin-like domain-containing protein [Anaeromicropila herbilytica]BCN32071.1 phage portal protein [Anaeromicropila herbilytica]
MGLPNVNISFIERAIASIARSERGTVALILKEATVPTTNPVVVLDPSDIPSKISDVNREQIELALIGYTKAPKKVICYFIANGQTVDYSTAYSYLEVTPFDYLAIPTVETDGKTAEVASWIKAQRTSGKMCKAVLPNSASDCEGIINFATPMLVKGSTTYKTEEYCSRIAGLLAGTPLTIASTFAPLPELTDCTKLKTSELDAAIDAGKFIVFHDGEKVKVGRGVNSLVTTNQEKGTQFKKIKIVEAMDMIFDDVKKTAEDNYLGKYSNSYDNKCLLISAINGYFEKLILDGILEEASVGIDIPTQRAYLKGTGVATDSLSDKEIKVYNTGDKVFLTAKVTILDAIEEISLPIYL